MTLNKSPEQTAGQYSVTADDETAGTLDIDTGMNEGVVWFVQIWRGGVMVLDDAAVTFDTGVLTVANGATTYALTEGDVIHWLVF